MSARCIGDDGLIIPNCELDQMLRELLETTNQFHGVDMRKHLHEANLKSKVGGHWYGDDFHAAMVKAHKKGTFNPGVVNVDSIYMPNRGVVEFEHIMSFLSSIKTLRGVLLIGNFILRQRKLVCDPNEIFEQLAKSINAPSFRWKSNFRVYTYNGAGTCRRTWMGSVVFYIP